MVTAPSAPFRTRLPGADAAPRFFQLLSGLPSHPARSIPNQAHHINVTYSTIIMNTFITRALILLFLSASALYAQVPSLISYQGRITVGAVNFNGSGQFKFAFVNTAGTTTYWSNDGTSAGGSPPAAAITLTVTKGLYSVLLGDTTLTNMAAIPPGVFLNPDAHLRVWFNDGIHGSQLMTPDQRFAAVGYAIIAGGVNLPATTSAAAGVIKQNGTTLLHTFGTNNLFAGADAGNFTTTGANNTASGANALSSNTTGIQNAAAGAQSLLSNTTGGDNMAIGFQALANNTTGNSNTASGFQTLRANTTGSNNTALGKGAGIFLTTGSNNIDIGHGGVAGESNIIRIGTAQTDTWLTGIIHGNGSGLTVPAGNVAGTLGSSQIAAGAVGNTQLASNLTFGGTTTGSFIGNVTGDVSGSAGTFTGALAGDVTGTQGATVVDTVGTSTAANIHTAELAANAASSTNLANTLVKRNGNGDFTAGTITVASGFNLPATTSSSAGVVTQNGTRLMHTFGTDNFFAGPAAGNFIMTGTSNTASGALAMRNITTGSGNTANGHQALNFNTTGSGNTVTGNQALYFNTTGSANTGSGANALLSNTTGYENIASGADALFAYTTGHNNTASGTRALYANTTGSGNIALGDNAGNLLTTGSNNIAIGHAGVAGEANTIRIGTGQTETWLTGIIHGNGAGLTIPAGNVTGTLGSSQIAAGAVGNTQLGSNLTLGGTTAGSFIGNVTGDVTGDVSGSAGSFTGVLDGDVTGTQGDTVVATVGTSTAASIHAAELAANAATNANLANTIVKRDASGNFTAGTITSDGDFNLPATTSATAGVVMQNGTKLIHSFGTNNFYAGADAGNFTTTGSANTALGIRALSANTTGSLNTATGAVSLASNTTGASNTANGYVALLNNTTGSHNSATGFQALSANTTGNGNTTNGSNSLYANTTGFNNTANGSYTLQNNTTASQNVAIGTTALNFQSYSNGGNAWNSNNVAVGFQALYANQPVSTATGINNTALGTGALLNNTTGTNNIAVGYTAGNALTTGDNNIDIGHGGVAGESNIIRIGTTQTDTWLAGIIHGNGSGLTVPAGNVTGTLGSSQIAAGTITATQIAPDAITTGKIADGSITGADIANGTIPRAKLAPRAAVIGAGTKVGDVVYAGSSGGATAGSSAATVLVPGQSITHISGGGPIDLTLKSVGAAYIGVNGNPGETAVFSIWRDGGTQIASFALTSVGNTLRIPPNCISTLDFASSAGSHTYELKVQYTGAGNWWAVNVSLTAAEY